MSSQPLERPSRSVPTEDNPHLSVPNQAAVTVKVPETDTLQKIHVKDDTEMKAASVLDRSLAKRLEQYDEVIESSRDLFAAKNRVYRDAIARTGVLGAAVELVGISARLESLVLASPDAGESTPQEVVNLVKDALNYAAIMGIMIMDDNWKPK